MHPRQGMTASDMRRALAFFRSDLHRGIDDIRQRREQSKRVRRRPAINFGAYLGLATKAAEAHVAAAEATSRRPRRCLDFDAESEDMEEQEDAGQQ